MPSPFVLKPCQLPARWFSIAAETVAVPDSIGRVLQQDVLSRRDVPEQAFSTRDGWVVCGAVGPWRVLGGIETGAPAPSPLSPGEAYRINTGGVTPEGATAVIALADASQEGDLLCCPLPVQPGQFIRARASDWKAGQELAERGTTIDPGIVAILTELGITSVQVAAVPRIAILSTGSEIARPDAAGTALPAHKRFASNGYYLQALFHEAGAEKTSLSFCDDNPERIAEELSRKAEKDDVIVTVGGTGKGRADFLRTALLAAGGALFEDTIAMRDSQPFVCGELRGTPVIGLPGNPLAVIMIAQRVLLPLVWYLGRCQAFEPLKITALMGADVPVKAGHLCVRIDKSEFPWRVLPVEKGTGARTIFTQTAGTVRAAADTVLQKDSSVTVELFFGQY